MGKDKNNKKERVRRGKENVENFQGGLSDNTKLLFLLSFSLFYLVRSGVKKVKRRGRGRDLMMSFNICGEKQKIKGNFGMVSVELNYFFCNQIG